MGGADGQDVRAVRGQSAPTYRPGDNVREVEHAHVIQRDAPERCRKEFAGRRRIFSIEIRGSVATALPCG